MLSTLNDVDTTISKLERNQPVTSQKTFFEWIAPPPDLRCAQLTSKVQKCRASGQILNFSSEKYWNFVRTF